MKKIIICCIFAFCSLIVNAQVEVFQGSLKEAIEKANKENKQVMIMVSTTWCGPCKYFANNVLTTPQAKEYFSKNYIFLHPNVDAADPDNIVQSYGVASYPSFIILDKEGNEYGRVVGSKPFEDFKKSCEEVKNDPIIKQRINFNNDPLNNGDDYLISLQEKGLYEIINKVLEKKFEVTDPKIFFTKYFHLLERINLDSPISQYMLNNPSNIIDIVGTTFYLNQMKKRCDMTINRLLSSNDLIARKNYYKNYKLAVEKNSALCTIRGNFYSDNLQSFESNNVSSLIDAFGKISDSLKTEDKISIFSEIVISISTFDDSIQYKNKLLETGRQIDEKYNLKVGERIVNQYYNHK